MVVELIKLITYIVIFIYCLTWLIKNRNRYKF